MKTIQAQPVAGPATPTEAVRAPGRVPRRRGGAPATGAAGRVVSSGRNRVTLMPAAESRNLIEALAQSKVYQEYERAFAEATGLLVSLRPVESWRLGTEHAVVVYGRDGLDEVSLGAATMVGELRDGEITEYEIHPEDFGLAMASNRALKVDTPDQSRALLLDVLDNQHGAARDIVILNAGVALYAANVADTMKDGVERARAAIESGAAKARLEQLVVTAHALSTPA